MLITLMSKERFTVQVIPQPTFPRTIEEIISRIPIGAQRRAEKETEVQSQINKLRSDGLEEGRNPTRIEASMEASLTEYIQLFAGEYRLDLTDVISKEEKERVFTPAIAAMKELAKKRGISLPEDILSRLIILDFKTYSNVVLQEKEEDFQQGEAGSVLPNGLCIINYDEVEAGQTETEKVSVRHAGVHELWHSLSYHERWVPETSTGRSFTDIELIRRSGFLTRRPGEQPLPLKERSSGLNHLNEGYISFLTRETLKLLGEKNFSYSKYAPELEVVDALIQRISEEPFIAANFTKRGFRMLYKAVEEVYGRHRLYKEIERRHLARLYPWNANVYKQLVEKYGRRVMLRYHPDLLTQYPDHALEHMAGLIWEDLISREFGFERKGSYTRTLQFIKGIDILRKGKV